MKRMMIFIRVIALLQLTGCGRAVDGEDKEKGSEVSQKETSDSEASQEKVGEISMGGKNSGTDTPSIWNTDEMPVHIRYDRMYLDSATLEIADPSRIAEIVDVIRSLKVGKPTDVTVDDYTDILTLTFEDGGMIVLEFEENNWVRPSGEKYEVEGLYRLRSLLEETMNERNMTGNRRMPTLVIKANGHIFYANLEDNSSAEAFVEKLDSGPLEVELHDFGSFEKVGSLPWDLPRNDTSITTSPGDEILYQGDQITIYYDENTWSFTRLAKIEDVTKDDLLAVFGDGDVTVEFWLEWDE